MDVRSLSSGGPMWTSAATLNTEDSLDGLPLPSTPTREIGDSGKDSSRAACSPFSELFPTRLLSENGVHVGADEQKGSRPPALPPAAAPQRHSTHGSRHAALPSGLMQKYAHSHGHHSPTVAAIKARSTGVKKHFCATCMSGYTRLSTLNKHTREKHPSLGAAPGGATGTSHMSPMRSCPFSGCKFSTRSTSALHVHKRKQHVGLGAGLKPMYFCKACRKRYKDRKVLLQHISRKHGNDASLIGCGSMVDEPSAANTGMLEPPLSRHETGSQSRQSSSARSMLSAPRAETVNVDLMPAPRAPQAGVRPLVPVRGQAISASADGDVTTIVVDALSPMGNSNSSLRDETPSPSPSTSCQSTSMGASATTAAGRHTATVPPAVFASPGLAAAAVAHRERASEGSAFAHADTAVTYACEVCSFSASDYSTVELHRRRAHPSVLMSLASNINTRAAPTTGASNGAGASSSGVESVQHVHAVRPLGRVGEPGRANGVSAVFMREMEKAAGEETTEREHNRPLFECIEKMQCANASLASAIDCRDTNLSAVRRRARTLLVYAMRALHRGDGVDNAADGIERAAAEKFRALAGGMDAINVLRGARGEQVDMWLEAAEKAVCTNAHD